MASLYALLLLLCSPAAAFRLHSFGRATSTPWQRRSATPALRNEAEPLSWKEQIERLLSPETPAEDRGILARDLLARGAEIATEVSSGRVDSLLTESAARDLDSVRRQGSDLLQQVPSLLEGDGPEALQRAATDAAGAALEHGPGAVASLLAEPGRAAALAEEAAEKPAYRVVREEEGFAVREYASHGVVAVDMGLSPGAHRDGGSAFSALTAYLLGANGRAELLGGSAPARIDVAAGPDGSGSDASDSDRAGSKLSFALPLKYSAATAPPPTATSLRLEQAPLQLLAVADFPGVATAQEVERQRQALLGRLSSAGVSLADEARRGAFSVLQYDAPLTPPWLRRNALAVLLRDLGDDEAPSDVD
ncbi:hypothetical protein EMIHUDRAFT_214236 [Emiliania huxleyi CCMP1516]|uniref:SOUL heme-binding protein n=2 Tax=Emiliania huxleyi TaxID=2903 RepID=A0A0D3IKU4_EMIH1|nr:hypothetical protein EMIHUDRAFT_214236 [Emiliania huxleyi CCMP1516]EOD11879.1 hypothetical protein EMIHUDRAFT_214236 [Emiliania huxleyi CCMP1516]|eukprot:XP_005764308.1 hypothetical protein EMIHUDRAFT_214236 [Emiliania huxleyi CCMP1516]